MTSIEARRATEDDIPFICDSWIKSYRDSPTAKHLSTSVYMAGHTPIVEHLLRERCGAIVLYPPDAGADEICGWICAEIGGDGQFVLHYVYIKGPYRGLGLLRRLMGAAGCVDGETVLTTHVPRRHTRRKLRRYRITVDPYLLREIL